MPDNAKFETLSRDCGFLELGPAMEPNDGRRCLHEGNNGRLCTDADCPLASQEDSQSED